MKTILLCEGLDDSMFITHYLHDKFGWKPAKCHVEFWGNDLNLDNVLHRKYNYYCTDTDYLLVIEMKGKDSLEFVLNKLLSLFKYCPVDFSLDNLVIVKDNDDNFIEQDLADMMGIFDSYEKILLENMVYSKYYIFDMCINVLPCILPYDVKGELETCLLNFLKETDADLDFIVDGAFKYVDFYKNYFSSTKRFLAKRRLIPKANLSATMSIVNPDASLKCYSDILLGYDWGSNVAICKYYSVIGDLITTKSDFSCKKMNIL